jgi:hypothetical protein
MIQTNDHLALPAAALLLALAAPTRAWADESELALSLEGGIGFMNVEDIENASATATGVGGTGMVQGSYGLTDLFALDLGVGGGFVYTAEFHDQTTALGEGNKLHHVRALRVLTGVSARFGARLIPTAGLHVGYQHRWLTDGALFNDQSHRLGSFPDQSANDLLAAASVGLDYRINRHWLVGFAVQATYAVGTENSFASLEIPVRVTYAWYPGFLRSDRIVRFE